MSLIALAAHTFALAPIPPDKPGNFPAWWFRRSVIRQLNITETAPHWPASYPAANDFAVLNLGQLKAIATAAYDEMAQSWAGTGGAGSVVTDMVKSWYQLNPDQSFVLVNGLRVAKTGADNYAVVNLGQLKAVAQPFFDHFIEQELIVAYPWEFALDDPDDYSVANLGQAKNLFQFTISGADNDQNGVPDWFDAASGLDGNSANSSSAGTGAGSGAVTEASFGTGATDLGPNGAAITDDGINPQFADGVTLLTRSASFANQKRNDSFRQFTDTPHPSKYYLGRKQLYINGPNAGGQGIRETVIHLDKFVPFTRSWKSRETYRESYPSTQKTFLQAVFINHADYPDRRNRTRHETAEETFTYFEDIGVNSHHLTTLDAHPTVPSQLWFGYFMEDTGMTGTLDFDSDSSGHSHQDFTSPFSAAIGILDIEISNGTYYSFGSPTPAWELYHHVDPSDTNVDITRMLTNEYTTDRFIDATSGNRYDYNTDWRTADLGSGPTLGSFRLTADQDDLSITQSCYKFHVKGPRPPEIVVWEVFYPDDDPATTVDESKDIKIFQRNIPVPAGSGEFDTAPLVINPALRRKNGVIRLLPVEMFVDNKNKALDPKTQALGVSNWVTTDGLPSTSGFGDICDDPKNFRLSVIVPDSSVTSVAATIKVGRDGTASQTLPYTLNKKSGNRFRGEFLRLVSDDEDDKVPLSGSTPDPDHRTIKVQLGDTIQLDYEPVAGGPSIAILQQVGRPMSEDDNGPDPTRHDIRELKVHIVVFKSSPLSAACVTRIQVNQDINDANERLAQAGIRMVASQIDIGGNGDPGVAIPQLAFLGGFNASKALNPPTSDERTIIGFKDSDPNTIDIFYVNHLSAFGLRALSYNTSLNSTGNPAYNNWIVITSTLAGGGQPNTLPHESMHILLDDFHRLVPGTDRFRDPWTSLFHPDTTLGKSVSGTKRIGPNPDTTTAGVGDDDTFKMRQHAENLP